METEYIVIGNTVYKKQELEFVKEFTNAKIINFPITSAEPKVKSLSCCKTDMIDWTFRGF